MKDTLPGRLWNTEKYWVPSTDCRNRTATSRKYWWYRISGEIIWWKHSLKSENLTRGWCCRGYVIPSTLSASTWPGQGNGRDRTEERYIFRCKYRGCLPETFPRETFSIWLIQVVGKGGLEPPSLAAHDPKSCSSANSDTPPHLKCFNILTWCKVFWI